MPYNKFITTQGDILLDLTNDTITPEDLRGGVTAHDRSGNLITGTGTESGGGSVETCTIIINNEIVDKGHGITHYGFTVVENGEIKPNFYNGNYLYNSTYTFENVICGSYFSFTHLGYGFWGIYWSAEATALDPYGLGEHMYFQAPTEAGAIATITLFDDD